MGTAVFRSSRGKPGIPYAEFFALAAGSDISTCPGLHSAYGTSGYVLEVRIAPMPPGIRGDHKVLAMSRLVVRP